jgi:hypothetical protein
MPVNKVQPNHSLDMLLVEELYAQAVEIGALRKNQDKVLMSVLYQGMRQPLKQMANYAFQTVI